MISITLATFFIIIGVTLLIHIHQFEYVSTEPLGPMFFPELLIYALILLSVIVIVKRVKEGNLREQIPIGVFILPLVSIGYVIALFQCGFLCSTLLFVFLVTPFFHQINHFSVSSYASEFREWMTRPATYLLLVFLFVLVWGVFIHLLYIPLPLWGPR